MVASLYTSQIISKQYLENQGSAVSGSTGDGTVEAVHAANTNALFKSFEAWTILDLITVFQLNFNAP